MLSRGVSICVQKPNIIKLSSSHDVAIGNYFFSKAHVLEASNIANHIPIVILLKTCVNCTYLESMLVILKSML